MALSSIGMRMTPVRSTIVMRKNPARLQEEGGGDYMTRTQAGDIASNQMGMMTDTDKYATAESELGTDVLVDEYGRPIVNREMAYLPDPRYSNGGHSMFALLWYGGFVAACLYIAWVFVTYEPEETFGIMTTGSVDPIVWLDVDIACSAGTTPFMTHLHYHPDEGGKCFNSSVATHPIVESYVAPSPLDTPHKTRVSFPLCQTQEQPYNANDVWPEIDGIMIKFINISADQVCTLDVFSRLNGPARPMKRLTIEGTFLKTFWMSYWRKREKHLPAYGVVTRPAYYTLLEEKLVAKYYELDAVRTYGGGTGAIVALRFADTANDVTVYDMRSWVKAGGIFGTLWYMISAYACFWAAPILICFFPRDMVAEAKAGQLDGYTDNALKDAWRPTVWLWIGGELIKRVSHAAS